MDIDFNGRGWLGGVDKGGHKGDSSDSRACNHEQCETERHPQ